MKITIAHKSWDDYHYVEGLPMKVGDLFQNDFEADNEEHAKDMEIFYQVKMVYFKLDLEGTQRILEQYVILKRTKKKVPYS